MTVQPKQHNVAAQATVSHTYTTLSPKRPARIGF
jgi:hypothetical protein